MIAANTLPGKQLILPNIRLDDIALVKNSSDRESIGTVFSRVWEKVADWFCGTDRTEAKKCVFDLLSPTTSDAVKIKSFETLKNLSGAGYQDRFLQTESSEKKTYSLNFETGHECDKFILELEVIKFDKDTALEKLHEDRTGEDLPNQLKKDIARSDYLVAGKPLSKGTTEERLAQFHHELDALNCTPGEKKSIIEVCNQSSIAMLITSTPGVVANCSCGDSTNVSFQISREDGKIHVQAQYSKDISAASSNEELFDMFVSSVKKFPHEKKSIQTNAKISIDAEGKFDIISCNTLANDTVQNFSAVAPEEQSKKR